MLLKVFVKRKAHGELCSNEFQYSEVFYEAPQISKARTDNGFEFTFANSNGEDWRAFCPTLTHGFELIADGITVDRYVTAVDEEALEMERRFNVEELTAFGNYILSAERNGRLAHETNQNCVTDADYRKFLADISK